MEESVVIQWLQRGLDWRHEAAILGPAPPLTKKAVTPASVELQERVADRQRYRVHVNAPAYLIVTDLYDKQWQATVNEQAAPIYRANLAFRAVYLPAGDSLVEFAYRPRTFYVGAGISLAAVVMILVFGLWGWFRERARTSGRNGAAPLL